MFKQITPIDGTWLENTSGTSLSLSPAIWFERERVYFPRHQIILSQRSGSAGFDFVYLEPGKRGPRRDDQILLRKDEKIDYYSNK